MAVEVNGAAHLTETQKMRETSGMKVKEIGKEIEKERKAKAVPGTIVYPDKPSAPAPVLSAVAAGGRRSLVIITGKKWEKKRIRMEWK